MPVGLIISVLAHAALILWGLVSLPGADPFSSEPVDSMPVELVSIGDYTAIKRGSKDAAPSEAPEAAVVESDQPDAPPVEDAGNAATPQETPPTEKTTDLAAVPDAGAPPPEAVEPEPAPEPEPEAAPPPPPEPTPAETKVEETPEPAPSTAPAVATAVPKKKPAPPKKSEQKPVKTAQAKDNQSKFNSDKISALLDKQTPSGGGTQKPAGRTALGSAKGTSTAKMSQTELDALRGMISRCWNPPVGATDGDALVVTIRIELNVDGSVVGTPSVMNSGDGPFFRAAADSARRAILRCQPYALPPAKYDTWREVVVNFDPREMFGG